MQLPLLLRLGFALVIERRRLPPHELINAPAVHLGISASDYVVNIAGVPFLQSADAGITGNSITLGVNGSLRISDPAKLNRSRGIPNNIELIANSN